MEKMQTELSKVVLISMANFLGQLQKAIDCADKVEIIRLYDFNSANSSYKWDLCPVEMQEHYDALTDKANSILDQ